MAIEYSDSVPKISKWQKFHTSSSSRVIGVLLLVALSFGLGLRVGEKGYAFVPKEFKVVNKDGSPKDVDYGLLWQALNKLNTDYIEKPIDQQKALYGAIAGAVASVGDPYTVFFEPKDLTDFKTSLQGSFEGIGAEVSQKDGAIVIVAPLDGSPAQKAGLLPKDVIASVDGKPTVGWSVDQAVTLIRGKKGTQVTLSIARQGRDKLFDVTITRDEIKIKSVKWDYKNYEGHNIGVITLSQFGDDTNDLFDQAVNDVLKHGVDGIILDLRNDPGGYLQTSVYVASNWVKEGDVVVTEEHSDGTSKKYLAKGTNRLGGVKTEVLINGGSASAAEILAGALRDHGIATLIGEKSFGKGSVQELEDLSGGSAIKITVAKWVTPNGKNLNHDGLVPDTEVKMSEDDIAHGRDLQMEKALQIVSGSK